MRAAGKTSGGFPRSEQTTPSAMNLLIRLFLGALVLALALAGCSTVDSRIKEKPAVFAQLDPVIQSKIKQGIIDVGFTPDMVYIALGRPDEAREIVTPGGRETVWTYNSYYDRYEGTVHTGYRRFVYWDPRIRAYRLYYEPVYANVYSEQKTTDIRVIFRDDKVTAIEQTKS
jgi:outer membrane protein assembly factor BamE (lipoprotein component of BamABCDE complex)